MMNGMVDIRISNKQLEQANSALKRILSESPRAVARAVNRTMDGLRTDAVKETSERYFVKSKDVRSSLLFQKATSDNLMGAMISRGKRHSLADYQISPRRPRYQRNDYGKKVQVPVTAAVKRAGGLKSFKAPLTNAVFLVKRSGGRYFPFYRIGKGKWKINSLISPSMPQIVGNEDTVKTMEKGAQERFFKRLNHEAMQLLGFLP